MTESDSTWDDEEARTTDCRDCGGLVSINAASCPHCGAPLRTPAGYYDDPDNPDRKRYWDGNTWGPAQAAPKPPWNRSAVVAGLVALGFLPWSFVATFVVVGTSGGSGQAASSMAGALIDAYLAIVVAVSAYALRDIRRQGGRGHGLIIGVLIVSSLLFLLFLRGLIASA